MPQQPVKSRRPQTYAALQSHSHSAQHSMDKYRTPRINFTVSPPNEDQQCSSEAMTYEITPLVTEDLLLMSQTNLSLKSVIKDSVLHQGPYWATEEGELNLYDPHFGQTLEAVSIPESASSSSHWSAPRLRWCAFCKGSFSTSVSYVPSAKTLWSSIGILLAGGFCGCFMAPYYINSCKKPMLQCSKCERPV